MNRRAVLLLFAAVLAERSSLHGRAQGRGGPPPPPPDRIRVRYFRIVYERLDQVGAEVTREANDQIIQIVYEGAAKVEKEAAPDAFARGDDGFRIFADRLVAEGRQPTTAVRITGEIVTKIRKAICPLFPFC